jgi:hypothetical protein
VVLVERLAPDAIEADVESGLPVRKLLKLSAAGDDRYSVRPT